MNFNLNTKQIERAFPVMEYADNKYLVSKNGDVTRIFEVELPTIFTKSGSELTSLHNVWTRAIGCLPPNTLVHKMDLFVEGTYKEEAPADAFCLRRWHAAHFNGKKYLKHRCILQIVKCADKSFRNNIMSSLITRKNYVDSATYNKESVRRFDENIIQLSHILENAEMKIRELTEEELFGDKNHFGLIDQYMNLNFTGENEILQDYHMPAGTDKAMVGDNLISVYANTELKEYCDEVYPAVTNDKLSTDVTEVANGLMTDVCMGLDFNHIYNQYFFVEDTKKICSNLEKEIKSKTSLSAISRENTINAVFDEDFLNDIHANGVNPVFFSYNLITWCDYRDKKGMQDRDGAITSAFANIGAFTKKVEGCTPQLFWAGIPGGSAYYPSEFKVLMTLPQACCFLNYESNYRDLCDEDRNGLMLTDRQFGIPVCVDVSNYPMKMTLIDNKNKFILGSSGSGKSFFTNLMVSQKFMSGDHIVIVDVGDSYQTLCSLINDATHGEDGIYYTYKDDEPVKFNPFYVGEDLFYSEEKIISLSTLIQTLWKNRQENFNNNELTQLRTALQMYIEKLQSDRSIRPCFNTFYEFLRDEYKKYVEKINVRIENFDIDNMLQVLAPYYIGGTYEYLLNSEENIDLRKKRFVVFELDNIKDNEILFPVVTLIIMDTFLSKMRQVSANERKMMLIEEAWKAISKAGMANFITYLFKTVRKHNGEVAVVTQEPDDLLSSPIVKETIINQSDVKILLDLSKFTNRFDKVKSALALSDKDASLALSVNKMVNPPYKEVFISFNGKFSAVYRVETSWGEAMAFTSRKEEKEEIYALQKKYGNMSRAINEYMKLHSKKK